MNIYKLSFFLVWIVILICYGCSEDEHITNYPPSVKESFWQKLDDAPEVSTNCFLAKGDTLFAGTVSGLYYTIDSGFTWRKLGVGELSTAPIHALISNDNKIFLGSGIKKGLYCSSDNGLIWNLSNNGLPNSAPIRLIEKENLLFAGMADSGVYVSADTGITWLSTDPTIAGTRVRDFTISNENIFVATFFNGVFLSSDNGEHWISSMNGITNYLCQCIFAKGDTVFLGTRYGGFRSTDGGQNWSDSFSGLPSGNIWDLIANDNYWFAGSDSGIYLSPDNGDKWISINSGLPETSPVYKMTFFFEYIYIYTASSGMWRCNIDSLVTNIQ